MSKQDNARTIYIEPVYPVDGSMLCSACGHRVWGPGVWEHSTQDCLENLGMMIQELMIQELQEKLEGES